jgi:hypothetical protein
MLPLLKRSTDNLVAVIEAKAAAGETFDVFKYVVSIPAQGNGTCIAGHKNIHLPIAKILN